MDSYGEVIAFVCRRSESDVDSFVADYRPGKIYALAEISFKLAGYFAWASSSFSKELSLDAAEFPAVPTADLRKYPTPDRRPATRTGRGVLRRLTDK